MDAGAAGQQGERGNGKDGCGVVRKSFHGTPVVFVWKAMLAALRIALISVPAAV
jgi:hypothetical protein